MTDLAMGNLDYERIDGDLYETEEWVTRALYGHFTVRGEIWECACGSGKMSRVLEAMGGHTHSVPVYSSDLFERGYGDAGVDFLQQNTLPPGVRTIITNPPYTLAEKFIRHALSLTQPVSGVVAMLLRNEYDSAKGRNDLFCCPPFAKKVVLTSRPRWIEGSEGSPRHNYAWFVFDWNHAGDSVIGYGHRGFTK